MLLKTSLFYVRKYCFPVNAEKIRGYRWFEKVLEIKPDGQEEYHEKGLSMTKLSSYNALISYNKAIKNQSRLL